MAHDKKEVVKKLREAFAIGADARAACAYAEITHATFYNWCEADPKLKEEFDRLREKPMLKAYQTIAKNLDSVETAKWYAEKKRRKEFGNVSQLELKGDVNHNVTVSPEALALSQKYTEELRQLYQRKQEAIEISPIENGTTRDQSLRHKHSSLAERERNQE